MAAVKITRQVLQSIVRHAQAEAPRECCGLLMGDSDIVTHHRPMHNALESEVRYSMEARELFQFFKDLRAVNQKHLGIYHSHPASEAYPSPADVRESFYPDCAYFIVSLKDPRSPQICAFRIENPVIEELEIIEVG
ncbi:MAG: M67 family metallopeptidase [Acidobacteria bacterium]|nr:M67 family metallopeptidase [Acidobacteriota bacterium]